VIVVNCPKCNKEMSEGYLSVSSGRGCGFLNWRKNKKIISFRDTERFTIMSGSFFSEFVPAFRCEFCEQITFSYNEKINEAIENERETES